MLSQQEFQNLYNQKSKDLVGTLPSDEEISDAYKSYLELVSFTGQNGVVKFALNKDKRHIKILFKS